MLISCNQLFYRYPNTETDVFADLSFQLERPGFHALYGPSGVGKTSLARMISGDLAPTAGGIALGTKGAALYTINTERLPGWSSVYRHLVKTTPPARRDHLAQLSAVFGLNACRHRRFPQLSLGQKNRVNLLRYLMQDFGLLIMDESLANVDESTRERIILRIKSDFPDRSFLYISHNAMEVSRFCDHILVLGGTHGPSGAVLVDGLDLREAADGIGDRQDSVILEIMNAA
jgi:ABC-type multidrug transport system ATPase subunit